MTYALRGCSHALLAGSKLLLASYSRVAAGGGRWLLTVVRGHLGDTAHAGRSMAYQATCAPLNVTSAWNVRPHFSMTRRDAWCPAAVALMIRASGVCAQPNRIASRAPSVASPRPQYSGASS